MTEAERVLVAEQEAAWGAGAPDEATIELMYREMGQSTAPDLTDEELVTNYVRRPKGVRG